MKIELKNIKFSEWGSEETNCFQANIYLNGKLVGYCNNDGKGGCTSYNRVPNVDYKVIQEMEEYCKGLPPITYKSSLIDKDIVIDMCLEHYLDELLEKHLESKHKAKMIKKLEKEMQKAILIGNDTQYNTISFKLPLQEMWENYPDHFKLTLKKSIEKYADKGYKLLNTNIPHQFLN